MTGPSPLERLGARAFAEAGLAAPRRLYAPAPEPWDLLLPPGAPAPAPSTLLGEILAEAASRPDGGLGLRLTDAALLAALEAAAAEPPAAFRPSWSWEALGVAGRIAAARAALPEAEPPRGLAPGAAAPWGGPAERRLAVVALGRVSGAALPGLLGAWSAAFAGRGHLGGPAGALALRRLVLGLLARRWGLEAPPPP